MAKQVVAWPYQEIPLTHKKDPLGGRWVGGGGESGGGKMETSVLEPKKKRNYLLTHTTRG